MKAPKLKYPNVKKLPPCDEAGQAAIANFLDYLRDRFERCLNDHHVLMMQDRSPRLVNMVKHFRAQLGTVVYLQSINDQRRLENGTHPRRPSLYESRRATGAANRKRTAAGQE